MDFQNDHTTENGLVELAKAGCLVDVAITGYGEGAKVRAKISKGGAAYGGPGFCLVIEGEGDDGATALRGAVATAETFLAMVPPRRPLPVLPEMNPPAADVMTPADPLRTAQRTGNRDLAEQGNERARELVDADQGLGR